MSEIECHGLTFNFPIYLRLNLVVKTDRTHGQCFTERARFNNHNPLQMHRPPSNITTTQAHCVPLI
jgi:hypothetical protein